MKQSLAGEVVNFLGVSSSGPHLETPSRWSTLGYREWERVLDWLDLSGLALLFWNRLTGLRAAGAVPAEIGGELTRSLDEHRRRITAMTAEFSTINECFENAGIRYAALKGFALIPDYCPDSVLRTTYDYDYLVSPLDVCRAEQGLAAAGWVRKKERVDHPLVYFRAACPVWTPIGRDDLYSPSFPRTIELHHHLWESGLGISADLPQDMLASARMRSGQGLRFSVLAEEDELMCQVLHAFRHILYNWCRLCSLHDIAYFLENHASDAALWERFSNRISGREPLPEIAGVVFLLAAELFGASIPSRIRAETVETLPSALALWVERYGRRSALDNFSRNKFGLFLHREFVHDPAVWRQVRRKLLFPMQRPNQAAVAASRQLSDRLGAAWKQSLYSVKRVLHHLKAALYYGWESHRWQRLRAGGR
ncbi:MAG TPA: nucleotidyltransferase family protein [Terriglobia bacterium]|nr:nucleotidyltransferase family protein [Terriglobia bacterium]